MIDTSGMERAVALEMGRIAQEQTRPSVLLKVSLYFDQVKWIAHYGSLKVTGETPAAAMAAFDKAWVGRSSVPYTDDLRAVLLAAADQFRNYEQQHRAKERLMETSAPGYLKVLEKIETNRAWAERLEKAATIKPAASTDYIDVVFDGPPDHRSPRFVETEDPQGNSIKAGEWVSRNDGYWVLRMPRPA